jgi:hypothetical protein
VISQWRNISKWADFAPDGMSSRLAGAELTSSQP